MVNVEHKEYNGGILGVFKRLAAIKKRAIYVGVPNQTKHRKGDEIDNAQLLFIHTHGVRRNQMIGEMGKQMSRGYKYSSAFSLYIQTHGSPLWRIPPRPVLVPAIRANRASITEKYAGIAKSASKGDYEGMDRAITRTGLAAQNACRAWFLDPRNRWPANSPSTVKKKKSSNPLIDEGELRKSIVYVVREE